MQATESSLANSGKKQSMERHSELMKLTADQRKGLGNSQKPRQLRDRDQDGSIALGQTEWNHDYSHPLLLCPILRVKKTGLAGGRGEGTVDPLISTHWERDQGAGKDRSGHRQQVSSTMSLLLQLPSLTHSSLLCLVLVAFGLLARSSGWCCSGGSLSSHPNRTVATTTPAP